MKLRHLSSQVLAGAALLAVSVASADIVKAANPGATFNLSSNACKSAKCETNADCGAGLVCENGKCVVDMPLGWFW